MKKGDFNYFVFTNNGEILKLKRIDNLFRHDVKLIIKRTFLKTSGGQGLYNYFSNEILDENLEIVQDNILKWNNISCKLTVDEGWRIYTDDTEQKELSVCMIIEIEDHFKEKNIYNLRVGSVDPFKNVIDALETIDRVGTHQGYIEIKKLKKEIYSFNFERNRYKSIIKKLEKSNDDKK